MTLELLGGDEPLVPCRDFLQNDFWGKFKASFGWRAYRFRLSIATGMPERDETGLLVLVRRLAFGLSFAYVAHGPYIDASGARSDGDGLSLEYAGNQSSADWGADPQRALSGKLLDIAAALKKRLPRDCAFIRFDLPHYRETSPMQDLPRPLRKSSSDVQPPDTVLVDVRPSEDAMLAAMKPKWRYNVKLAEKKGVKIGFVDCRTASPPEIDEGIGRFYGLYRETAARDRIALHGQDYYRRLFEVAAADPAAPSVRLYFAEHEGRALAAIIVLIGKDQAVYLYGASSNEGRNLMPAYALQWRAMRDAKASGCSSYDMFGIPPNDDPGHPMHGLYRFKTGFGGRVVHRLGCWDYPLNGFLYGAFSLAEAMRSFWFKKVMKLASGKTKKADGPKGDSKQEE
jgi:lipid II:glycine glycyltransferase (peptidoglycan interpeptide bridge formation enzyme)